VQLLRNSRGTLAAAGCAGLHWIQQHSLYINLVAAMAHRLQASILAVGRTQPTSGHTYADSMSPGQRRIRSCKGTVSLKQSTLITFTIKACCLQASPCHPLTHLTACQYVTYNLVNLLSVACMAPQQSQEANLPCTCLPSLWASTLEYLPHWACLCS